MTIKTTIKEKMNYQEARNELGKQKKIKIYKKEMAKTRDNHTEWNRRGEQGDTYLT